MLYAEYLPKVGKVLKDQIETVKKAIAAREAVKLGVTERTEKLKTALKGLVEAQMVQLETARVTLKGAQAKVVRLAVGITGDPEGVVNQENNGSDLWQTTAVFVVALALDLAFNMGLVRSKANPIEAIAFSFTVSIAGSLGALWSASYLNRVLDYYNAVSKHRVVFKGEDAPRVANIDKQDWLLVGLSMLLMTIVVFGSAVYRAYIATADDSWFVGSFGFGIVILGFFLYKMKSGKPVHPLAGQYVEAKDEAERLVEEVRGLENFEGPEMRAAFGAYDRGIWEAVATRKAAVEVEQAAKAELTRLVEEAKTAPSWFVDQFDEAIVSLTREIESGLVLEENTDELKTAKETATPKFDVDLTEAAAMTAEVGDDSSESELAGRVSTLGEVLPQTIWTVTAQKGAANEAAVETKKAAVAAAAEEVAKDKAAVAAAAEEVAKDKAAVAAAVARLETERQSAKVRPVWAPKRGGRR